MDIWIVGLILIAVASYATQSALYGKYSRKYSWLQAWAIRNISMIVTWLPLLFLVQDFDVSVLMDALPLILVTAFLWWVHVLIDFDGLTYLPIWVAKVIKIASKSFFVLILSLIVLWEIYTWPEWLGVLLVLAWWIWLWIQKIDIQHLEKQNISKWIYLVILAGLLSALSWYFYKLYADRLDIFLASYLLEASIWVAFIVILFVQRLKNKPGASLRAVSGNDIMMMSLIWLLPYVGTLSVTKAFEIWGFWITSLLMNLTIPASFVIARFLFKEKITLMQWLAIAIALAGLVVMKLG